MPLPLPEAESPKFMLMADLMDQWRRIACAAYFHQLFDFPGEMTGAHRAIEAPLTQGSLWKAIWVMTWPLMITTVTSSIVGMVDVQVAGTLGPTAVAFFTDRVFRDPLALRYSLAVVNCIGMIATIGLLVVGMPAYRRTSQALAASR